MNVNWQLAIVVVLASAHPVPAQQECKHRLPSYERVTQILTECGFEKSNPADPLEYRVEHVESGFSRFPPLNFHPGEPFLRVFVKQWRVQGKKISDERFAESGRPIMDLPGDEHADVDLELWESSLVNSDNELVNKVVTVTSLSLDRDIPHDRLAVLATRLSPGLEKVLTQLLRRAEQQQATKPGSDNALSSRPNSLNQEVTADHGCVHLRVDRNAIHIDNHDPAVADVLIESMDNSLGFQRGVSRLVEFGPGIQRKLIDTLQDPTSPWMTRWGCINALPDLIEEGQLGQPENEALLFVMRGALADPSDSVRASAIHTLRFHQVFDPATVRSVLGRMKRAETLDGGAILLYAEQLPESYREIVLNTVEAAMAHQDPFVHCQGAILMGKLDPSSGEPAKSYAQAIVSDYDLEQNFNRYLSGGGEFEDLSAALTQELTSTLKKADDKTTIVKALGALARQRPLPEATRTVIKQYLSHDDAEIKQAARRALQDTDTRR